MTAPNWTPLRCLSWWMDRHPHNGILFNIEKEHTTDTHRNLGRLSEAYAQWKESNSPRALYSRFHLLMLWNSKVQGRKLSRICWDCQQHWPKRQRDFCRGWNASISSLGNWLHDDLRLSSSIVYWKDCILLYENDTSVLKACSGLDAKWSSRI